tara:strand:- start:369 stop:578 length:210 start_codon:yes stop_codon:yes gene_type:complete
VAASAEAEEIDKEYRNLLSKLDELRNHLSQGSEVINPIWLQKLDNEYDKVLDGLDGLYIRGIKLLEDNR